MEAKLSEGGSDDFSCFDTWEDPAAEPDPPPDEESTATAYGGNGPRSSAGGLLPAALRAGLLDYAELPEAPEFVFFVAKKTMKKDRLLYPDRVPWQRMLLLKKKLRRWATRLGLLLVWLLSCQQETKLI